MGVVLMIVSLVLSILFWWIGLAFMIVKNLLLLRINTFFKRINAYFLKIAISIDQLGNVIMQDLFNSIIIKESGYKFGKEDETISSVIGKNQKLNTLRVLGKILNWILCKLEKNHSINSIEEDE